MLKRAAKILEEPVCQHCLGRQYSQLLSGYANHERGKIIRKALAFAIDSKEIDYKKIDSSNFSGFRFRMNKDFVPKKEKKCSICDDFFKNIEKIVDKVARKVKGIEFKTFLVGTKISNKLLEKEERLWQRVGIEYCEPIKAEINREVGKLLEKRLKKRAELKKPDIAILLNLEENKIEVKINPLYVFGYYKKLKRGMPQCRWGTPKKYRTSVEQIIAKPFMPMTKGKDHKFHGCIAENSLISLNECTLPIKNLENYWEDHEIITFNRKNKTVNTSKIKDFIKLDTKKLKIRTFEVESEELGRRLVASSEHPLLTQRGTLPLSKLKRGDKVAIYPIVQKPYKKMKNKTLLSEADILKTIKKYVPTTYKSKAINELKENGLLPLKTTNRNIFRITRLLAFLFGDGSIRYCRDRDVFIEFYAKREDLDTIRNDIKELGFKHACSMRKRRSYSEVEDFYDKKRIISGTGYTMTVYSKSLWILLVSLGAPLGDKVLKEMNIPKWIKEAPKEIKKEFLASLFGAELSKPRLDKRKHNRKSFNTHTFSINKSEKMLRNGVQFVKYIKKMLQEFGINTLAIRRIPYTTRKDGNKTYKIRFDISNKFENLINLYENIGFRYCKEREITANYVYEYLMIKRRIVGMRKKLYKKSLKLKKEGLTPMEIFGKIGNKYLSYKNIALWVVPGSEKNNFENIKVPNNFPSFEEWLNQASENLRCGLVWETIKSIKEVKVSHVYDLTTANSDHTFFANGFLVSNSGREDIDALCLDWRAFVLEIVEPKKRKVDLKKAAKLINRTKKVEVKGLKISSMDVIRKIKAAKSDKTYRAIVKLKKKVRKQDLKKLRKLKGEIKQKTPQRVLHRRAELVRKRQVKAISWKQLRPRKLELKIKGTAGLYIKELISGDKGRTRPSVAELLGTDAVCTQLDVIKIGK